jgi:hypothetical protein
MVQLFQCDTCDGHTKLSCLRSGEAGQYIARLLDEVAEVLRALVIAVELSQANESILKFADSFVI